MGEQLEPFIWRVNHFTIWWSSTPDPARPGSPVWGPGSSPLNCLDGSEFPLPRR